MKENEIPHTIRKERAFTNLENKIYTHRVVGFGMEATQLGEGGLDNEKRRRNQ